MRKMIRMAIDYLMGRTSDLIVVDHAPVQTPQGDHRDAETAAGRRAARVKAARERHGRPFKCAAQDLDREVMITPGTIRIIAAHRRPIKGLAEEINYGGGRTAGKVERLRRG